MILPTNLWEDLWEECRIRLFPTEMKNPQPFELSQVADFVGGRSGVRTLDTLIKSQVLCQLS